MKSTASTLILNKGNFMTEQILFVCPVCKQPLKLNNRSLVCSNGHSFDIAKQGYVNLLMSNKQGNHGDDKLMVNSRQSFLEKGFYAPMREKVNEILGSGSTVLDAGCGEGYYTSLFAENNFVFGIDVSKEALKKAAKKAPSASFAVASIYEMPFSDSSLDVCINIFAPDSQSEYLRVLKKGGRLITVTPMAEHLMELKSAIYDTPYENPYVDPAKEGFEILSSTNVKYGFTLDCNEDVLNLFKMTPYYYNTSQKDAQKLNEISSLDVNAAFLITEYKKI